MNGAEKELIGVCREWLEKGGEGFPSISEHLPSTAIFLCDGVFCSPLFSDELIPESSKNGIIHLRLIQFRVVLLLTLWKQYGAACLQAFVKHVRVSSKSTNKKKRTKRGKSKTSPKETFLQEVMMILQKSAFHLPPHVPFQDFVHQCLAAPGINDDVVQIVCNEFEILHPREAARRKKQMIVIPSPVKKRTGKRKRLSANERQKENCHDVRSTTNIKDPTTTTTDSVLPRQIQLTAPSTKQTNSLLGRANTRYVGSHFNGNLSNIDHLFRQVKRCKPSQRTNTNSIQKNNNNNQSMTNSMLVVQETPLKPTRAAVAANHKTVRRASLFGNSTTQVVAQARRAIQERKNRVR